jgi:hypothetical protein
VFDIQKRPYASNSKYSSTPKNFYVIVTDIVTFVSRKTEKATRIPNVLIYVVFFFIHFSCIAGDNGVLIYPSHSTPAPYHHQPIGMRALHSLRECSSSRY